MAPASPDFLLRSEASNKADLSANWPIKVCRCLQNAGSYRLFFYYEAKRVTKQTFLPTGRSRFAAACKMQEVTGYFFITKRSK